ncbi:DUF397 domain-containing protein [Streptomyces sp. XD-27]|uniref:DUF397 domain-containing protein n=1 Tax=Streptomyces sp. XD-27 TaxID=3062779 RepID=UPI0026F40EA7|nr:DUF397 domain-containing protein [Streptomyces sp. XD-27]WKX71244.1 DUF397 domain-containing protein [Streptomyces sp. XD-27]
MDTHWRKSSFSDQVGNCVELASCDACVLVRESDDPGVVVEVTPQRLRTFLAAAKAGEFDRLA